MTSRERVPATLNHREPDRVPVDLGSTILTSMVKNAPVDVTRYPGMPVGDVRMSDHVQRLPYLDKELLKRFGVDFLIVRLPRGRNELMPERYVILVIPESRRKRTNTTIRACNTDTRKEMVHHSLGPSLKKILAIEGGILIGSLSEVHDLVPAENALRMYQTVKKYGNYPIKIGPS